MSKILIVAGIILVYMLLRNEFVYRTQIKWIRQKDDRQYLSYDKMMLEFWKWKY